MTTARLTVAVYRRAPRGHRLPCRPRARRLRLGRRHDRARLRRCALRPYPHRRDESAGAPRARERWRIFGWSAMLVAVVTGIELAAVDGAFDDASSRFDAVLVVKVAAVGLLIAGALLHDFVLGPRLARQIRAGRPETARRPLVIVGWANLALTLAVPVLGAALGHLS